MRHVRSDLLRARKAHECIGCFGEIAAGEQYWKHIYTVDEYWHTAKLHQWCESVINEMLNEYGQDIYDEGDVLEWAREHDNEWTQGPGPWRPPRMDGEKSEPGERSDG